MRYVVEPFFPVRLRPGCAAAACLHEPDPMEPVEIEFFKPDCRRYRSVLHRRDGLVVELDGGGYNKVGGAARELPHDLSHFVVEDGLGLEAGLWDVLAAGGMFGHAKVIEGRRPPHAAKRAQAVVDAAGDRLSQAEMLTRSCVTWRLTEPIATCGGCWPRRARAGRGRRRLNSSLAPAARRARRASASASCARARR